MLTHVISKLFQRGFSSKLKFIFQPYTFLYEIVQKFVFRFTWKISDMVIYKN